MKELFEATVIVLGRCLKLSWGASLVVVGVFGIISSGSGLHEASLSQVGTDTAGRFLLHLFCVILGLLNTLLGVEVIVEYFKERFPATESPQQVNYHTQIVMGEKK